jgi:sigma-54 dependent transcriptional regulator, acetoin dehydrogenase operon transcriptional activator AcoR
MFRFETMAKAPGSPQSGSGCWLLGSHRALKRAILKIVAVPEIVYDDRRTRQAREDLLRNGLFAAPAPDAEVPAVILRSWRRCLSVSVPQSRVAVPYLDAVERHAQLIDAATPVIDRVAEHLDGIDVAMFLSDNKGQIILRRVNDRRQRNVFDNASAAEGFDFSENTIGTNGLGTVIEERQPVFVRGSEHFNEALESLACAGVPIFKPNTRKVVGSFAFACRSDAASALQFAMARDVGRRIEGSLADMQGHRDRAVAQAYLTARQSEREPVIVLSQRSALANTLGLQYLTNEFHALLWDALRGTQAPDISARRILPVGGGCREAIVERVAGTGDDATYLVRLLPADRSTRAGAAPRRHSAVPRRSASSHSAPSPTPPEPVHPSEQVHDQVATAARLGECLVVDGRSGTGKLTVALAALSRFHQAEQPLVIDVAVELLGDGSWHGQAAMALSSGCGVILTHLQDLPARQVNLVKAIAHRAQARPAGWGSPETAAAATCPLAMTVNLADSPDHVVSLVSQIATVVELPTLQAMSSQIPRIVRRTLADMPLGRRPAGFSTGALQALMRWDWPGNFTELRRTVEQLARRMPGQSVDACHLPARFQGSGPGRPLSMMEFAERETIIAALRQCGGRKGEAAAALGIGRTTLYRKIRIHRIPVT